MEHGKAGQEVCVTEQLKAENQMKWVQLMNTISHQIDEIILNKVVYGGAERLKSL